MGSERTTIARQSSAPKTPSSEVRKPDRRPVAWSSAEKALPGARTVPLDFSRIPALSRDERMESEARSAAGRVMGGAIEGEPTSSSHELKRLNSEAGSGLANGASHVSEALRSPGARLSPEARGFYEPRFGYDFSEVRIHAGAEANESARVLHAQAYTLGRDVVFARGKFSRNAGGQELLAHELAHVVQQGSGVTSGVQRAPNDAGVLQDAATQSTAALDLDVNEAAIRAQNPDLAQIDRAKQSPTQNEDAVKAIVMDVFGSEDALNDAFESLSPFVIKEVDKYAGADPAAKTANRTQFFVRMRLYFDSWDEMLQHFRDFVRVNRGKVDVVLHSDAARRLERALDVLEKNGHPFPTIGVGFGLRGFHQGDFQTPGFMIHALGYAVDVAASENPKIGFMKPGSGPGRHDPMQIASSIDPARGHMDMGPNSPATIEAMGKSTEADHTLSAADDKDPKAKEYFDRFQKKFEEMQKGSLGFLGTLSKDHRDKLLQLRQDYFKVLKSLADEKKKGKKSDAKVISALEAERRQLLAVIPTLVTEWITAIDAEISKTLKAHPGMDKMRSPAEVSNDLKSARGNLAQAQKNESQAQTVKASALAARDAAKAAFTQAEARERRASGGSEFKKALEAANAARENLFAKMDAIIDPTLDERRRAGELSSATATRDNLATELKSSDDPKLAGAWDWIASLKELRKALSAPDLSTPSGLKDFEGLTTGDLQHMAPVDNPPLLRLLEVGFFNPKGAFDLEFFEEMAHSGFIPGATWNFGGADPMHFELLEGRDKIRSPGNFKLEKKK